MSIEVFGRHLLLKTSVNLMLNLKLFLLATLNERSRWSFQCLGVYFCLDGDDGGIKSISIAAGRLAAAFPVRLHFPVTFYSRRAQSCAHAHIWFPSFLSHSRPR